jgi:hypothetical protein
MVFDNPYNREIKSKLLAIANRKIAHDNYVANNPTSAEPKSQQDFISVVHPELEGGSGNLAHTSYDLGIESKAVGDGSSIVKYRKTRAKKLIDAMQNTQPITEGELQASGIIGAGKPKPKRVRVKKVLQGGDFNDVMRVTGDVLSSGAKIAAHAAPLLLGLGKQKPNEWNSLVAKVRKEHGLSLKDAMVHIKNNNLYQKKTKVKTGGAARLPLTDASVNANIRPAIVPETRMTGNVKSLKFNEGTETVIKPRRNNKLLALEDMPRSNKKLLAIMDK